MQESELFQSCITAAPAVFPFKVVHAGVAMKKSLQYHSAAHNSQQPALMVVSAVESSGNCQASRAQHPGLGTVSVFVPSVINCPCVRSV